MAFMSDRDRALGHAEMNLSTDKNLADVGLYESFSAGLTQTVQTELWISEWLMRSDERDLESKIDDLIESGDITQWEAKAYRKATSRTGLGGSSKPDYERLSVIAKERGLVDLTIGEVRLQTEKDLKRVNDQVTELQNRPGYGALAWTGGMAGGLVGSLIDPPNLAASLVPVGSGVSLLRQITAGAALNMATEAAIQPQVMQWKGDLGIDHSLEQSVQNIALAGLMGAGVPAFVAGVKKAVSKLKKQTKDAISTQVPPATLEDPEPPFSTRTEEALDDAPDLVEPRDVVTTVVTTEPEFIYQTDYKKLSGKAAKKAKKQQRKAAREAHASRMEEVQAEEARVRGVATRAQATAEGVALTAKDVAKQRVITATTARREIETPGRTVMVDGVPVTVGAGRGVSGKLTKAGKKRLKHKMKLRDEQEVSAKPDVGSYSAARAFRESAGKTKEQLRSEMPETRPSKQQLKRAIREEAEAQAAYEKAVAREREVIETRRPYEQAAEQERAKIAAEKEAQKAEAYGIAKARERRNRTRRIAKLNGPAADLAEGARELEDLANTAAREVGESPVAKGSDMTAAQVVNKVDEVTNQIQRETRKDVIPQGEIDKTANAKALAAMSEIDQAIAQATDDLNTMRGKVDLEMTVTNDAGAEIPYREFKKSMDQYIEKLKAYEACRKGGAA